MTILAELTEVMNLAQAEFLAIHALCDKAEIPRLTDEGEVFSASQRVAVLSGAFSNLAERFLDRPQKPLH